MRGRSLAEAFAILEPAADGLAAAHGQQVAHRDVKPANIFLLAAQAPGRPGPQVKVLDFGIAKIMKEGESAGTKGTFASFTWLYATPEQLDPRIGATGLATDVYAFALLVTELLTDRRPVDERDVVGIMKAATDPNQRPTPRTRGANIPDEIEAVCRRALAVDPKDRFASISELWAALVAARDGARGSTTMQPPPVVPAHQQAPLLQPPPQPLSLGALDVHPLAATHAAPPGHMAGPHAMTTTPRHGTPLPMTAPSPPLGTRPPGLLPMPPSPPPGTGPPGLHAPMMPYGASPPPGTLPPGHAARRLPFVHADGTSPVAVVTIILFVLAALFAGSCAAIHSACNATG